METLSILVVFGTRPEWIKIRPLLPLIDYKLLFTGQHTTLIDDSIKNYSFTELKIPDGERLNSIVKATFDIDFSGVSHVLVQGDTTTAFGASLAAFHKKVPIIHLEAGLRTYDLENPYPEEFNRQAISSMATIHLCVSESGKQNLLTERKSGKIYVVGNTGLDNLIGVDTEDGDFIFVTLHRRENHPIIREWLTEIDKLGVKFILPLHPNPNIVIPDLKNGTITKAMSYSDCIKHLSTCKIVVTDSGGLQEEASFLQKPCIVCRKKTERVDGLGSHSFLCDHPSKIKDMFDLVKDFKIDSPSPYGDGYSAERIARILNTL